MSAPLRWKLIGGFLLVFVAGVVLGAFIGGQQARRHRLDYGKHGALTEKVRHRMQARLDLTPEQMERTAPILDKTAQELETIRDETARRVHEAFTAADRQIAPALTPEQRAKMESLEAQHHPDKSEPMP